MKLGFHLDGFSFRGTVRATYDYAESLNEIYGYEVFIIRCHRDISKWISDKITDQFKQRFDVIEYYHPEQSLKDIIRSVGIDAIYILNDDGFDDRLCDLEIPIYRHAVFPTGKYFKDNNSFAVISHWLSREFYSGFIPVVPHIIKRPSSSLNLRSQLGIRHDDLVVGSLGGKFNFNLRIALQAVEQSLQRRSNLWVLLLNHVVPLKHERLLQLPGSGDRNYISQFINTCDYMLHARSDGETFGLSCGDFSSAGRPVIAWSEAPQRAHLEYFVLNEHTYSSQRQLTQLLCSLDIPLPAIRQLVIDKTIPFSSCNVVKTFSKVFIERSVTQNYFLGAKQINQVLSALKYPRRRLRVELQSRHQIKPSELTCHSHENLPE